MSSELAPKPRLVLCPRCRQLLPESPDYDVYKCGGCGITLQAKKRRSRAVTSESSSHETNAVDNKQDSKGEQLATPPENGLRLKASSSSSGECSLDENGGIDAADDKHDSKGEQLAIPQENGLRLKASSSSSGECSLDGNGGIDATDDKHDSKGEQLAIPQENGLRLKALSSSSGECSLDGNGRIDAADDKQDSNGEHLAIPRENGLRLRASSSSSGECSLDENGRIDAADDKQDSKGEQLAIPQENSLRVKASSSSSGECSLDGNGGIDQIENGKCNGEQVVLPPEIGSREEATTTSSREYTLDGSIGRGRIENGECNREQVILRQENSLRGKAIPSSSGESSLDENDGRGQTEDEECNEEKLGPFNLSDEEPEKETDSHKLSDIRRHRVSNKGCSDELTNSEIEASTELLVENSVENANEKNYHSTREEISNGNMPLEGPREERIHALDEDVNNEKSALVVVKPDITESDLEGAEKLNNEDLLLKGAEQELISGSDEEDADIERSALVSANHEVDITKSSNADAKESNNRNSLLEEADEELNMYALNGEDSKNDQSALVGGKTEDTTEKGSTSPHKIEEGTSGNYVSSPNKHLGQAEKNILRNSFNRVRSVDTFDAGEVINLSSSELSGNLGELSKSQTTRSFHAYEGSVSSNDVADDISETRFRKGKGLVDSMLYGVLETHKESYFPNTMHQALKTRRERQTQNQAPEITRYGHPHWARTRGDEFPSKMPFHQNGSQSGYESGSPSNQTHDDLYYSPSFLSPDTYEDPDQEKMKLLSMVYELHDQLNRTSYINRETNGRLSYTGASYKGKHISPYHSHDLHGSVTFPHGLDYPRCGGRCSHGINNSHQMHTFSPPYVAETTTSTHRVDHRCLHCRPQEREYSAELCRPYLAHNCCSSHHSYPSSPQWLMPSKLPLHSHEIKSGDQRHMAPQGKKYLREKQNLTRRHYRPVAGGAPFVTCHKCFRLLQLPADFLLFKRVCHRLKCGACSEVLKFSLQNQIHMVSYSPNALKLPSSDLDDQNEVINGRSLHSASHGNHHHSSSQADPISYSDDCGRSVSKSYSSEGDPVSVTPSHSLHGTVYDNSSVSHGTVQPITEEKIASGGEKLPSEMKARSPQKSSTLHQLMGYSSPIHLIRGTASSVEESILKEENDLINTSQQR